MSGIKATTEDVRRLASLARISVPEEDLARFAAEFDSILGYVGKLEELQLPDMGKVSVPPVRNVMREDGEPDETGLWTKTLVAQFPQREENLLSVKQIITHE